MTDIIIYIKGIDTAGKKKLLEYMNKPAFVGKEKLFGKAEDEYDAEQNYLIRRIQLKNLAKTAFRLAPMTYVFQFNEQLKKYFEKCQVSYEVKIA